VLLFHGAPGSRLFGPSADVPRRCGVRLITFDRPGFGGSDRREGRTVLDTAGDVTALADGLGVDRFAVVGVSAGGAHALACAFALGDRVSGVAVASMPGPLDEVPGAWDALDRRQRPAADMAREDPVTAAGWGMADDLVALWMRWGFGMAELRPGVRLWHGAQDTRAEPDFRYLSETLPGCHPRIWPHGGHYGVLRHWPEVIADLVG
jgi:pimeloyl-ACP methyl ester carboxylesterase